MARSERLYLGNIVVASDAIRQYLGAMAREEFLGNEIVRRAILQRLTEIGEAASRVSRDLRERYPGIPWADVVAFRNIAVHAYFSIDWHLVWVAATRDAPVLANQVTEILAREFPDQDGPAAAGGDDQTR